MAGYRASSGPRVGLNWEGRFGRWADMGVHVLAACVVDLQVLAEGESCVVDAAVREVSQTLQDELPEGAHCVNLRLVGPSSGRRFVLRAALVCETETCQQLRQAWQRRRLCGGSFTAMWASFSDTSSPSHSTMAASRLGQYSQADTGLVLELPAHWVAQAVPAGQESLRLTPGSHWFDFSTTFGQVVLADLMRVADPNIISLLVRFAAASGAQAMFEALTDRYMYNPMNTAVNDTHPVVCAIGSHEELLERLRARPEHESGFILRRAGVPGEKKAGPSIIHITFEKNRLVIGREETCDIMLRRAHVSKAHATVALQSRVGGPGYVLTIQDTSANGTWVNTKRLRSNVVTELSIGDRISFLPEQHEFYKDALIYEVASGAGIVEGAVARQSRGNADGVRAASSSSQADPNSKRRSAVVAVDATQAEAPNKRRQVGLRRRPTISDGAANVHLAQPVELDVPDNGVVADNGVVDLDDDGGASQSSGHPEDTVPWTVSEDVGAWVRGLDGGNVAQYESTLLTLFDNVSQIRELYKDRLTDFFADVQVEDPLHRLAFSTALKKMRH